MELIRTGLRIFVILWVITGIVYPLVITVIARVAFPVQADGSLVQDSDGRVRGSLLIGQPFSGPAVFWSRPSATAGYPYNPLASGGSNLGPTNEQLISQITDAQSALERSGVHAIASDLVMNSASGLDPEISVAAALAQVPRVAKARGLSEEEVRSIVIGTATPASWGFIGDLRVNVLRLNIALSNVTLHGTE